MNVAYECFCSSRYHESRYMSPVYVLILFSSKHNFKKYCGKIETSLYFLIFVIPCVFVGSFLEGWLGFLDFICTCCTVAILRVEQVNIWFKITSVFWIHIGWKALGYNQLTCVGWYKGTSMVYGRNTELGLKIESRSSYVTLDNDHGFLKPHFAHL